MSAVNVDSRHILHVRSLQEQLRYCVPDTRVSRQHCQVFLHPVSHHLYLIDGAPSEIRSNSAAKSSKIFENSEGVPGTEEQMCVKSPSKLIASEHVKPSLNGIFVNGRRINLGACDRLSAGDEVSLVACTKGTQSVDPGFGPAVGFVVQALPQQERYSTRNQLSPANCLGGGIQKKLHLKGACLKGENQACLQSLKFRAINETQEVPTCHYYGSGKKLDFTENSLEEAKCEQAGLSNGARLLEERITWERHGKNSNHGFQTHQVHNSVSMSGGRKGGFEDTMVMVSSASRGRGAVIESKKRNVEAGELCSANHLDTGTEPQSRSGRNGRDSQVGLGMPDKFVHDDTSTHASVPSLSRSANGMGQKRLFEETWTLDEEELQVEAPQHNGARSNSHFSRSVGLASNPPHEVEANGDTIATTVCTISSPSISAVSSSYATKSSERANAMTNCGVFSLDDPNVKLVEMSTKNRIASVRGMAKQDTTSDGKLWGGCGIERCDQDNSEYALEQYPRKEHVRSSTEIMQLMSRKIWRKSSDIAMASLQREGTINKSHAGGDALMQKALKVGGEPADVASILNFGGEEVMNMVTVGNEYSKVPSTDTQLGTSSGSSIVKGMNWKEQATSLTGNMECSIQKDTGILLGVSCLQGSDNVTLKTLEEFGVHTMEQQMEEAINDSLKLLGEGPVFRQVTADATDKVAEIPEVTGPLVMMEALQGLEEREMESEPLVVESTAKPGKENGGFKIRCLSGQGPGVDGFCLNRLEGMDSSTEDYDTNVSLQELLAPMDDLVAIFAATFTSDILWFLSSNSISPDLPVTVACHDYERCWSTSTCDRSASPYMEWPNVTVVYPPFPDICAFGTKKEGKRRGIGCHHPKFFLLQRQDRMRVVICSANLTERQWLHVTNTVWWKDFPRRGTPDYKTLFQSTRVSEAGTTSGNIMDDFGAQLAHLLSSLLIDVPTTAQWVVDVAHYDFSSADASMIVSIPGLHGSPYPAFPNWVMDGLKNGSKACLGNDDMLPTDYLGVVGTTVVGVSYRFSAAADPQGSRVRALAILLSKIGTDEDGMITVILKRAKNVPADSNAVSVFVGGGVTEVVADLFLQGDPRTTDSRSLPSSQNENVQLGFLPRSTAKWVAPLCDEGICTFMARIWPKEALAAASCLAECSVQLVLYVFELLFQNMQQLSVVFECLQCPLGLQRLQQVLNHYNWPNSAETDFYFGSSSIGTSLDAPFLAAFSAAAGRRAISSSVSEDSDPEWGCWTAEHEAEDPSIGIVFPSIERVRSSKGPLSHYGLLCFSERTWERLKPARLLHDAVPSPAMREGVPMHVKVAMRRFQYRPNGTPFGWVYCGSHNFSPAAWGRPLSKVPASAINVMEPAIHIYNYELGLIFMEPPPADFDSLPSDETSGGTQTATAIEQEPGSEVIGEVVEKVQKPEEGLTSNTGLQISNTHLGHLQQQSSQPILEEQLQRRGLDRFRLPFVMPPPKYGAADQPATGRAMYRVFLELQHHCNSLEEAAGIDGRLAAEEETAESGECEASEEAEMEATVGEAVAPKMEQQYVEALWSQITD